ncbi:hypothetical protein ACIRN4_15795 [Pimelobacter simplex]|uniref:hypothetical protein n=1 Tax=Nocardioides simplex TaxID=2045 RepID=UPI0038057D39
MGRRHPPRLAVALVLCLLALLGACRGQAGATDGPVRFDAADDAEQFAYIKTLPGREVVFGALGVTNHGDRPATLVDARLTGPSDQVVDGGARLDRVLVRDASHGEDYVGAGHWPNETYASDAVPLEDYELAPGATAELLYIVRVDEDGHWFWPRSAVTYTSNGRRYEDVTSTGFLVCPRDVDDCRRPE